MRTGGRNDRLWRFIYVAEVIFLAAPVLLPMALLALVGAVYCSVATLFGLAMLIGSGDTDDLQASAGLIPLGSLGTLLCFSGLAATNKFRRLSMAYIFEPTTKFRELRGDLRLCLQLAAAPLVLTTILAGIATSSGESHAWGTLPFFSGLILLFPLTHLWLALRKAEQRGTSETAALPASNLVGA